MEERPVGVSPLPLSVREGAAAQLPRRRRAEDRRDRRRLAGPERQRAGKRAADAPLRGPARRERVLDAEEPASGGDRRALRVAGEDAVEREVDEADLGEGDVGRAGRHGDLLPHVRRAVAEDGAPGGAERARRVDEVDREQATRNAVRPSRGAGHGGKLLHAGRTREPQPRGVDDGGADRDREGGPAHGERLPAPPVGEPDEAQAARARLPLAGDEGVAERQPGAVDARGGCERTGRALLERERAKPGESGQETDAGGRVGEEVAARRRAIGEVRRPARAWHAAMLWQARVRARSFGERRGASGLSTRLP